MYLRDCQFLVRECCAGELHRLESCHIQSRRRGELGVPILKPSFAISLRLGDMKHLIL